MTKYRKKPVVIEAEQWFPGNEVEGVLEDDEDYATEAGNFAFIQTLEGEMQVSEGDWIITGVKGEKYPVKPDIFEATYEPADAERYFEPSMRPELFVAQLQISDEGGYQAKIDDYDGMLFVREFEPEVSLLEALDKIVAYLRELDEEARRDA